MIMSGLNVSALRPGLLYGAALCATYVATGLTRALWLNEAAGPVAAAVWEGALYLVSGVLLLSGLSWKTALSQQAEKHPVLTGLLALALYGIADALIAVALCGVPLPRHMARFLESDGRIQLLALLLYAALPLLWFHDTPQRTRMTPRG